MKNRLKGCESMAASNTKKKTQNRNQGQSSKRTTSSAKKTTSRGKTKKRSVTTTSDWLVKILLVAGVIAIIALLIGFYKQDKEKETGGIPTSTPTPTVVPTLTMTPIVQPEASATPIPTTETEPTKVVTQAPTPTQIPTTVPTPTKEPAKQITAAEALTVLRKEIDETTYTISMLNDHLMLGDGKEYYMFCISDATGDLEPLLLVEKETGVIKCYTLEGVLSDFSGFPLDKVETPESSSSEISRERALELLKKVSKEKLGLAKELSEYDEVTYDDWTTMVNGNACYSLNVFELSNGKMRLRGTYYVSLDGSKLYKLDGETNEFIPIN